MTNTAKTPSYPTIQSDVHFPKLERDVLDFWQRERVFEQSVENRPASHMVGEAQQSNNYIFYDGPPFANGLPHHGHLLTGYVKDMVARYQTMQGRRVERRFGWDCHGLPAEMESEKQLGVSGRQQIMAYGVEKFNAHCRSSVMQYRDEWEAYVNRQARWVDFENDYKTMDTPYMESVLWAFGELYKKGLIYEGFKVMPYSWAAETVLSSSEIRLDDATREKVDKAITVAFKLKEKPAGAPDADEYYLLAWTTTPWTLPSNLALAVSAEMEYCAYMVEEKCSPDAGEQENLPLLVVNRSPLEGEQQSQEQRSQAMRGGNYPSHHTDFAQEMRKNPTKEEALLWAKLSDKQLEGYKFRRQQPIGHYIVDFYCPDARLIVELDGSQHAENNYDVERDAWLKAQDYYVLRVWNNDVLNNVNGVLEAILEAVRLYKNFPHAEESKRASVLVGGESIITSPHASASGDALAPAAPPQGGSKCFIIAADATVKYGDVLGKSVVKKEQVGVLKDFELRQLSPYITISGKSLINLPYEPLFPYFANHPNAFRVLDGTDFIEEGSGTGVVHMAPGFGEDDMRVCAANGIDVVVPVDNEGRYNDAIFDIGYLETDRCILKIPTLADEANFVRLHTNAQVMETVNDGLMSEEEAKADFARNMAHFKDHGYGQWAVYHKESGAFIGRAGLTYVAQAEGATILPTLRCALLPEFWHGGYGSELCAASLDYGFTVQHFEKIAGGALLSNTRSHVMMERLGMKYMGERMFKRTMGPYYLISKEEWQQGAGARGKGLGQNMLCLKGLNVIAETKGKREDEPYTDAQLAKYGLANLRIIQWLKGTGQLIKQEDYAHNYPHCWRTDKPIIYRAMSSWFVDVPKIRDRMVELNQQINWIPEHIKDGRFGKWIENAREWSISRSRFWGCPIPVWRSDNPDNKELYVFGSIAELEAFFGGQVTDLHKPFIDTLTKSDPLNANYTIKRVDEVFDCWFESGSMPYAQVHYPFENKEWFEANFPADFIVEYEAQTRGWFYNMMVLSVALFDRIPFKNCICHGVVLDGEGRKLSKKLKNYVSPMELFDSYGSDALRWFMLSSTIMRGNELFLDAEGVFIRDSVRLYIKPLWNAYHFFCLYANADGVQAAFDVSSENIMDRYILAKLKGCVEAVEASLNAYDTPSACHAITAFLEVLNNWYIRRNRARFWGEAVDADKQAAYNTLYTVLHVLCRVVAPLLPQVSEAIFAGLVSGGVFEKAQSVHLQDYPHELQHYQQDNALMQAMDRVQDICNTAHAIRNEVNIRIRQPLARVTIYGAGIAAHHDYFKALIADEINVKEVVFSEELEAVAQRNLKINFPIVGKRLPAKMKAITTAARAGQWQFSDAGQVLIEGETLVVGEFEFTLQSTLKEGAIRALSAQDGLVVLDTTLTEALLQEGIARDVVRLIQQSRKEAGLDVADRITLTLDAPAHVQHAVQAYAPYVQEQTLCVALHMGAGEGAHRAEHSLGEEQITLLFDVAEITTIQKRSGSA